MRCYCGAKDHKLLFLAYDYYQIVQCFACGQVRTITPFKVERKQIYNKEDISVYIEKEAMFRKLFKRVVDFIKQYKSDGRLVDIGAGVGFLVDEARWAGFDARGIEPSFSAVLAAKKFFHIQLLHTKFTRKSMKKPVDIVVLNHVLEHLPNPHKVIRTIVNVLEKDGLLVIGVPNFGSIMSILKKGRWQSLIPDQHRWHFTFATLDQLVQPQGFYRLGVTMENHDRSMHPLWKLPIYWVIDMIALLTNRGEAILVVYRKKRS